MVGLIVGAAGDLLGVHGPARWAVGIAALVIGVAGAIGAYRDRGGFTFDVAADMWQPTSEGEDGEYELRIDGAWHGLRNPTVTTFVVADDNAYEEIYCGVRTETDGTVVVTVGGACHCWTGQVRIS